MIDTSFAHRMAMRSLLPSFGVGMTQEVKIGMLVPLSGSVQSLGLAGVSGLPDLGGLAEPRRGGC